MRNWMVNIRPRAPLLGAAVAAGPPSLQSLTKRWVEADLI